MNLSLISEHYRRNSMTLLLHSFLWIFILVTLTSTPHILSAFFPNIFNETSGGVILVSICIHIALLVYFYLSKKYNLFALPISHAVSPLLFFFIMWFLWQHSSIWKAFETPWESFVIIISLIYFLPIAVITFIISLFIKLTK
jgi:hypothetical protein